MFVCFVLCLCFALETAVGVTVHAKVDSSVKLRNINCADIILTVRTSLVAQAVKRLPTMRETRVQSLGWEDPLGKEMATHSSTCCLENPTDGGAWEATAHGVIKSRTRLSDFSFLLSY